MGIEFKDTTGRPRPDSDIAEALDAITREVVTNPTARFKDGCPAAIHYITIIDALKELLAIRAIIRKKEGTQGK